MSSTSGRLDGAGDSRDELREGLLHRSAILNNIPDIAWLKDGESRFLAVNAPFGQACGLAPEEIVGKTDYDIWPRPLAERYRADDAEVMRSRARKRVEERLAMADGRERWIETIKTPIFDHLGNVIGTTGIARDITERREAEAALTQVSRLYALLGQINQAIMRTRDRGELYRAMCKVAIEFGGFRMAWVGILDEARHAVVPVAHAGHEDGYLAQVLITVGDEPSGGGPTGVALREEAVATCDVVASDPRMLPWRAAALARGYQASAAVPFRLRGQVVGVLSLYAAEPGFFSAGERRLLEEIGAAVSFALEAMEAERERKQSERALRESELRYRMLFETMAQGAVYQSSDGRITGANQAAERILGVSLEQMQGRTSLDLRWRAVHEDGSDFPGEQHPAMEALRTGQPVHGVTMGVFHPGWGECRWILVDAVPETREGESRPWRVYTTFTDITDRKRAEETLRAQEHLLSESQRIAHIGTWSWEVPDMAITWSAENYRLHGVSPETFTPTPEGFLRLIHPEDRPSMQEWIRACLAREEPPGLDFRVVLGDGRVRQLHGRGDLVCDAEGRPRRMVGTAQDVTEQRQLEARYLHAQKMESIGTLAGGVAHDFNNQLSVILGYAAEALARAAPGGGLHADLMEIRRAAERSADLTRQLLAFARRQTATPKVVNLNEVITGLLTMLRRVIGENIELEWVPQAELWPVRIDPAQVDQVLANLCVNARDAITGVGRISISTRNLRCDGQRHDGFDLAQGEYVLLEVSDSGGGMDEETKGHLFEPFFTTKGAGRGTGLGLATVYGIVKQNDGFIDVVSEPGRGTTFGIYLHRCAGQVAEPTRSVAAEPPGARGETVLLVEDDPSLLRLGATMLRRLGYAVLATASPREAVHLASAHPGGISLLITDVVMPGMNGLDLAQRICAQRPEIRCLFMSAYTADVIARQGMLPAHLCFLQKPFALRDLAVKAREALESAPAAVGRCPGRTAAHIGGDGMRVLLVEDDESLLQLLGRHLERCGHRVRGFPDPAAALATFRSGASEFDCVVTDVGMPGMSGFELARAVRAIRADMPLLLVSGVVTPEDQQEARTLGLCPPLPKPRTVREMASLLDRLIRQPTPREDDTPPSGG